MPFFCLVCSLPNKSANSVSLVPYLHISKISTTGLLPAYFSKFLKIFFSIFFKIYQIHLRLMHKACVSYAWNLTEIYVLDDPEICLRIAEDTLLEIFLRWVINKWNVLSFWPFWMKFSLFWCKYAILDVCPGGSTAIKMFPIKIKIPQSGICPALCVLFNVQSSLHENVVFLFLRACAMPRML